MKKERFAWYQKEIARLKEIDKQTTNRVRASYKISRESTNSLKKIQ